MGVGLNLNELNGLMTNGEAIYQVGLVTSKASPFADVIRSANGGYTVNFSHLANAALVSPAAPVSILNVASSAATANNSADLLFLSPGFEFAGNPTNRLIGWNAGGLLFSKISNLHSFEVFATSTGAYANGAGIPAGTIFNQSANDIPFGLEIACFAEGTAIATPVGEAAIEDLRVGDRVTTASGASRPIRWIGQSTVRPAKHPRPHEVNPVRIKRGAFGEGLPVRDLVVSPGHAVFIDGVLIPVGLLINGATIVQEQVETIRYFHVELDGHDVLLAAGLPCESYLDDGNRSAFTNGGEAVELHGRLDPKSWEDACAPWVGAGPQLDEVQRRLHARAEAMGWMRSDEPDLHLIVDGVTLAPVQTHGLRYWFQAPACVELVLASNASVLAQVMPGLQDLRRLGVAVSELKVNGEALALDAAAFGPGFHALETQGEHLWRWTDGAASLALGLAAPAMVEVGLHMVAPAWKRRAPALKLVKMAS